MIPVLLVMAEVLSFVLLINTHHSLVSTGELQMLSAKLNDLSGHVQYYLLIWLNLGFHRGI